jgi:hypothetical protein
MCERVMKCLERIVLIVRFAVHGFHGYETFPIIQTHDFTLQVDKLI